MFGVGAHTQAREGEPCKETRWLLAWVITRAGPPDARHRARFVRPSGLLHLLLPEERDDAGARERPEGERLDDELARARLGENALEEDLALRDEGELGYAASSSPSPSKSLTATSDMSKLPEPKFWAGRNPPLPLFIITLIPDRPLATTTSGLPSPLVRHGNDPTPTAAGHRR
jgi:hypothetical protein